MLVFSALKRLYWRYCRLPVWAQDGIYHLACLTITAYIVLLLMSLVAYVFDATTCSIGEAINVNWMQENCRIAHWQKHDVGEMFVALLTIAVPIMLYVLFYHLVAKAQREGKANSATDSTAGEKGAEEPSKALAALKRFYWRYCRLPVWAQNGLYHLTCLTIAAYIGVLLLMVVLFAVLTVLCSINEAFRVGALRERCFDAMDARHSIGQMIETGLSGGVPALLYILFYHLVAKEQPYEEKATAVCTKSDGKKKTETNSKGKVHPMAFA